MLSNNHNQYVYTQTWLSDWTELTDFISRDNKEIKMKIRISLEIKIRMPNIKIFGRWPKSSSKDLSINRLLKKTENAKMKLSKLHLKKVEKNCIKHRIK